MTYRQSCSSTLPLTTCKRMLGIALGALRNITSIAHVSPQIFCIANEAKLRCW